MSHHLSMVCFHGDLGWCMADLFSVKSFLFSFLFVSDPPCLSASHDFQSCKLFSICISSTAIISLEIGGTWDHNPKAYIWQKTPTYLQLFIFKSIYYLSIWLVLVTACRTFITSCRSTGQQLQHAGSVGSLVILGSPTPVIKPTMTGRKNWELSHTAGLAVNAGSTRRQASRTSLMVQWLRLHFHCRGCGFDPWSGSSSWKSSGMAKQIKKTLVSDSLQQLSFINNKSYMINGLSIFQIWSVYFVFLQN